MREVLIFLHVLGATVWTGGHLVLALTYLPGALKSGDGSALVQFEKRYHKIGMSALVLMVLTGPELARQAGVPASRWFAFDGPMSTAVGIKLTLVLLTIALAVHARIRLLHDPKRLPMLAFHVAAVTLIGVALVWFGVTLRMGGV